MSSNYFGNDGATQFQGGGYGGYASARDDSLFVSLFLFLSLSLSVVLRAVVVLLLLLLLLLFEMMGFDF